MQKGFTRNLFQFSPQFIGAEQQRNVIGVLEICLTDDARFTVGTAPVMAVIEPIDGEDTKAAFGSMISGGTAYSAGAKDGDVVRGADGGFLATKSACWSLGADCRLTAMKKQSDVRQSDLRRPYSICYLGGAAVFFRSSNLACHF